MLYEFNGNTTQDVPGVDIYFPDGQEDIRGSEHMHTTGGDSRSEAPTSPYK